MKKSYSYPVAALMAMALSAGAALTAQAAWEKTAAGRYWYSLEEGNYATGWKEIDGIWYYFDDSGWMETGWLSDQGNWYYLDPISGAMTVSQWVDGYYLNSQGIMEDGSAQSVEEMGIGTDTVFPLLRAALSKEGLYPEAVMRIDRQNGKEIVVNIGEELTPSQFKIYNRYTVDRSTGKAVSDFTGSVLYLK